MNLLADTTLIDLLDSAPDAIMVIDGAGLIVLVNAQVERFFNYRREELLGTPVRNLVPIVNPKPRTHLTGLQMVGRRRDGSEFLTEVSMSSKLTDVGFLLLATFRDVTERIQADQERTRINTEAELVRVKAEGERVLAEGEKQQAELVRVKAEGERVLAEGEKQQAERVRVKAEGERVLAEGEKQQAELVRIESEAQRESLEGQLHQSRRMESLGQLAGGIAHDFNNLLAVILNYASFVAEELTTAASGPKGAQWEGPLKDIEQIQLAAERGALLTHQLLAFARREVVQSRALSLNKAITRMEQILRRTIGEQIKLTINLSDTLPMVMADPGQIEQIVLNLAINARDAMISGGTLSIGTELRAIGPSDGLSIGVAAGSYACVTVRDNGIGMSGEIRDRAFEPFFTTKPRGEGSGLGLATVYGIVSQTGGCTTIISEPGAGTSIEILLPVVDDQEIRDEQDYGLDEVALAAGTETILVVDDEDALREVTRRILTRNGYTVVTASNGSQAMDIADSHPGPIDLLITDMIMPGMQGPEVAKEIRKLRPGIRVVFMSGHAKTVLEAEAILGTEFLLVEKPFDQAVLLENVRIALARD